MNYPFLIYSPRLLLAGVPAPVVAQAPVPAFSVRAAQVRAQMFKVQILLNSYGKLILWNRIPASRFCGRELCGDD